MAKKAKKKKTFRVWIDQVNATFVDVKADSESDATEKGYEKWRNEEAHSCVTYVQELE